MGLTLKNVCLMFVYTCIVLCLCTDWCYGLTWERGHIYERFWSVCLIMMEFDCPEVTLCGWQDVKLQLLSPSSTSYFTSSTQKKILFGRFFFWGGGFFYAFIQCTMPSLLKNCNSIGPCRNYCQLISWLICRLYCALNYLFLNGHR